MRVMVIVKATKNSEAGLMPNAELFEAMGAYNEKLIAAGIMKTGDGLKPSSHGKRLTFSDAGYQAETDGPFTLENLIAGFWLWEVTNMDEAVAWARQCPNPMPGEIGTLEIRPFYEMEDFA